MGGAPSMTATLMYDICLDNLWTKKQYGAAVGVTERQRVARYRASRGNQGECGQQHIGSGAELDLPAGADLRNHRIHSGGLGGS